MSSSRTIKIEGIHCGSCIQKTTDALKRVAGVLDAVVSLEEHNAKLTLAYDVGDDKLNKALREAGVVAHVELKLIAWLSSDERARFGTRRRTRPAQSWFDTRSLVGWPQTEVDFVRRLSLQCSVWPMFVVPSKIGCVLLFTAAAATHGNRDITKARKITAIAYSKRPKPRLQKPPSR